MLRLDDDRHCFACGEHNPIGLHLAFTRDGDGITTEFTPAKSHQGYKDITHGGIITTVLDELMAQAAIRILGVMAATAEFKIRFKEPLMTGQACRAAASITQSSGRIIKASASMARISDGAIIAVAESTMWRA